MDANGVLHDPWLEHVHDHDPAHAHEQDGGHDCVGLEDQRHDHRRRPGHEWPEERDRLEQAGAHGRQGDERQAQQQVRGQRDQEVHGTHQRLPAEEAAE